MKIIKQIIFLRTKRLALNAIYRLSKFAGLARNTLSVLCYHGIEERGKFYSVTLQEFEKQIEKIRKTARFISMDDVLRVLDGRVIREPELCLTIDDGYTNVMKILPITKKYKIPVAIFVLSNPKNANRNELDHNGRLLTFREVKYLHFQGWTIGCHSATHANFKRLTKKQLEEEIVGSKKMLEEKLGFRIDYFAYPKGIYNKQIIDAVKKAGYKAAFAAGFGCITSASNKWKLPRNIIDSTHTAFDFPAVYSPTIFLIRGLVDRLRLFL